MHTLTTLDPATTPGAVTLSVSSLSRSHAFYTERLGLQLLAQASDRLTFGVGQRPLLHLVEQPGAQLIRRATGLYHFALLVSSRQELARLITHLRDTATALSGASDHAVSEAFYLNDPDGHGIELYRDRPRDQWYDAARHLSADQRAD